MSIKTKLHKKGEVPFALLCRAVDKLGTLWTSIDRKNGNIEICKRVYFPSGDSAQAQYTLSENGKAGYLVTVRLYDHETGEVEEMTMMADETIKIKATKVIRKVVLAYAEAQKPLSEFLAKVNKIIVTQQEFYLQHKERVDSTANNLANFSS